MSDQMTVEVMVTDVCECAGMFSDVCVVLPGGEASGPGQTGVAQHPQEADGLPAGSAGDRHGEQIRQVAVGE